MFALMFTDWFEMRLANETDLNMDTLDIFIQITNFK
jgi:hypothetical protein